MAPAHGWSGCPAADVAESRVGPHGQAPLIADGGCDPVTDRRS